jgi:hypothetical protein
MKRAVMPLHDRSAAKLPRHQRIIVELSVHILRGGMTRAADSRVDCVEVRLALRCLVPHCRERWPLDHYWSAAKQSNEIGRSQGVTAAFNGIVRQLRQSGCYEDVSSL